MYGPVFAGSEHILAAEGRITWNNKKNVRPFFGWQKQIYDSAKTSVAILMEAVPQLFLKTHSCNFLCFVAFQL